MKPNTKEEFDWNRFFQYCESLVDVRKFNNLIKWKDRKGILEVERYKEKQRTLF